MMQFLGRYTGALVLVAIGLALLLGIVSPALFGKIHFLGEIFINLLKLFALPLISSTLMVTLGSMGKNLSSLKRLARTAVSYMVFSEIAAVSIAIILFNWLSVGRELDPNLILQGAEYGGGNQHNLSFAHFLVAIFPQNIFDSLAKFELLPVVIFSTIFGIGCSIVGASAQPLIKVVGAIRDVASRCLNGLMLLSPIAIFALVGSGVAASHGHLRESFTALIAFVSVLSIGFFIHLLWQLALVMILTKQRAAIIFKESVPVFSTAFATSSSVATLPAAIESADKLGSDPTVTRFMLPLSAAINIGGMMMYEVAAALFFSQVLGLELSLSQQILVAVASILGGMAEGGIPESSLVSLVVVFKIVNVPLNAISVLLPLDRIIDRLRTVVNIFGNLCGVVVVSQFLKKREKSLGSDCLAKTERNFSKKV